MRDNSQSDVDILYKRGAAAWEAGRLVEAAMHARAAIALEPDLPALHFLLGSALMQSHQWAEAVAAFAKAMALGIDYPMSHHCALQTALARTRIDLAAGVQPQRKSPPVNPAFVSCVICSITPDRFRKISANLAQLLADVPHEIIGIHDARSLCEGYNRGARQSRGDILLFCHDDIEIIGADFAARLLAHLQVHELVGVAGSTRLTGDAWLYTDWRHAHGQIGTPRTGNPGVGGAGQITVTAFQMRGDATAGAQVLDGVLMAARRELWQARPFDEATFDGWHLYDFDFSFSAHRAGRRVAIAHDLLVVHESTGDFGAAWQAYAQKFIAKYGIVLATPGTASPPELCSVTLHPETEWALFSAHLSAG